MRFTPLVGHRKAITPSKTHVCSCLLIRKCEVCERDVKQPVFHGVAAGSALGNCWSPRLHSAEEIYA